MHSLELRFSNRAIHDIRTVLRYTRKVWGETQRESFSADLNEAFHSLRQYPSLGQREIGTNEETRSFPFSSYIITYVVGETSVTILRVQHQRMNPSQHSH